MADVVVMLWNLLSTMLHSGSSISCRTKVTERSILLQGLPQLGIETNISSVV